MQNDILKIYILFGKLWGQNWVSTAALLYPKMMKELLGKENDDQFLTSWMGNDVILKKEVEPWFLSCLHISGVKEIRPCVVLDPTTNEKDGVIVRVVVCFEEISLGRILSQIINDFRWSHECEF